MTDELIGIGAVILELSGEFPDLTVSKVRFLEAQGLLTPVRTPSGYRRYSRTDRDRLRYILTAQRDHFLPLKVIGEHLDAMSRGLQPPSIVDPTPRPPDLGVARDDAAALPTSDVRLSRDELLRESGLAESALDEAIDQGLLTPGEDGGFGLVELEAARAVAGFADHGVTPRHLRAIRLAADRHIGFVDQIVSAAHREGTSPRDAATALLLLSRRLEGAILAGHLDRAYRGSD